ncbi:hypothetical protein COCON_G00096450 [Conger conger]|uniref:Collagen alpha-1(XII) chain n=1 Tax=Conger conger TaxID=82655 RepID=A0A9Q1DM12_CONCO|nr:hypothetical protein COCON_G00096450 [Conger conger]
MPSEPIMATEKTQPMKVSVECSLGVDVQADVVLLVDGSYSIGLANFAKVRAFLEVLVKTFNIGRDKVQISLVQYSRDPHTEFALNTHNVLDAVVKAVRTFPYRGGSTNLGRAMTYVRENIFVSARGARTNVPRITILITDGKSSDAFKDPATRLRSTDVEIFAVGVKDAIRSELEDIASEPKETHVYTVEDCDAFQRISKELTQSICLRIEQELLNIKKRSLFPPRSLTFSEVISRSFRASWLSNSTNVLSYLVQFKNAEDPNGEYVSISVPGGQRAAVPCGLSACGGRREEGDLCEGKHPGCTAEEPAVATEYNLSVTARYSTGLSDPLIGRGTTLEALAGAKTLAESEETERSMKVTWQPAPGKVVSYRVTYRPKMGGKQLAAKVPGNTTSTVLKKLQPLTAYDITRERCRPGELLVGPYDNTVVLEELRAGTKYSVNVFGMFDGGHSTLAGEEKTTLSDAPEPPPINLPEIKCKTSAKADIILLVDGSWSIGRQNFQTIRAFIGRMVGVFNIGPNLVQIGLAQYSGDPKTEWHLNAYKTRKELLDAVANLPYKGGNTMTGLALNYILQNNFRPNVGLRPDSKKIGVLITDGKSQDEIIKNSENLRKEGIELYAVGVKNADENELRSIASDPDDIHMYNVEDFSFLQDIVDGLTDNLCNSVKGSDGPEPPTNLETSEVTHRSFRATWTAPAGSVEKYRLEYMIAAGGPTHEMSVNGTVTTAVLNNLNPLTEYIVKVFAVSGDVSSEPLKGTETTLPVPSARNLRVFDETTTTMKVRWDAAAGATGYQLLYRAVNATVPSEEKEVRVGGGVTEVQLEHLFPNTLYSLSLIALHGEEASDPISGVTHSFMKLNWDAAPGNVRKYIITYKPEDGDAKEIVDLSRSEPSYALPGARPALLQSGNSEGAVAGERSCVRTCSHLLRHCS